MKMILFLFWQIIITNRQKVLSEYVYYSLKNPIQLIIILLRL